MKHSNILCINHTYTVTYVRDEQFWPNTRHDKNVA